MSPARHGPPAAAATSAWVSTPNVRGTYDLLLSCLLTLLICAWTAYHPNIPAKTSSWALIGRRMKWVVVAVLAPELVLAVACLQFHSAWKLKIEINAIIEEKRRKTPASSLSPKCWSNCTASGSTLPTMPNDNQIRSIEKNFQSDNVVSVSSRTPDLDSLRETATEPWTMLQAFFALAGGIGIDAHSFYPLQRIIFEPNGIAMLARLGILPNLRTEEIKDKSKADALTKSLVCIQAGWFFVQSIARVQQDLPLTLLEIHTNTHVLCAFLMYAIWAKKPYDVGSPMLSPDERVVDMAAFFATQPFEKQARGDQPCQNQTCTMTGRFTMENIESAHQKPLTLPMSSWRLVKTSIQSLFPFLCHPVDKISEIDQTDKSEHLLRANRAIDFMRAKGFHIRWSEREDPFPVDAHHKGRSIDFGKGSVTSYVHTLSERQMLPWEDMIANRSHFKPRSDSDTLDKSPRTNEPGKFMTAVVNSMVSLYAFIDKYSLTRWVFVVFCAVYGGAHLSAWDSHFPSVPEKWLWRVSALCLAAGPFIMSVIFLLMSLDDRMRPTARPAKNDEKRSALSVFALKTMLGLQHVPGLIVVTMVLLVVIIWIPPRLYLLVEAFASLRSPPDGTYVTENWTTYWPHAS